MVDKEVIVKENFHGNDNSTVTAILEFDLIDLTVISGNKVNSDIQIKTDSNNPNNVIGFKLTVVDSNDQKIRETEGKIARLVCYLPTVSGSPIEH